MLVKRLQELGFELTQASVSRDLNELGVEKVNGIYAVRPKPIGTDLGTITLTPAGPNLLVGKCLPGLASAITVRIDSEYIEGIIGTIAGDDTIFVAVQDAEHHWPIIQRISEIVEVA